jgi:heme exporter protein D
MSDWLARLLNTLAFFVWLGVGTMVLFMPLLWMTYVEVVR